MDVGGCGGVRGLCVWVGLGFVGGYGGGVRFVWGYRECGGGVGEYGCVGVWLCGGDFCEVWVWWGVHVGSLPHAPPWYTAPTTTTSSSSRWQALKVLMVHSRWNPPSGLWFWLSPRSFTWWQVAGPARPDGTWLLL